MNLTKFLIPEKIVPLKVKIIMICEGLPLKRKDYFYSSVNSLYITNTIEAFNNAGIRVNSIDDIIKKGVYLTVAVKEIRKGLTVQPEVIRKHSNTLEAELNLFPNVKAILLMGDTAIKALNLLSKRMTRRKVIPEGSTYKIRKGEFFHKNIRVFPSYLQTGKNFLIEKSKRRMVAEDINNAFKIL